MHDYRSHKGGELRSRHIGETVPPVRLGASQARPWRRVVHRPARHVWPDPMRGGGGARIYWRPLPRSAPESVVTITGKVAGRKDGTVNAKMPTGEIEVRIEKLEIQSAADVLPFQVAEDDGAGEDIRLKYRYLDLRREGMHSRVRLRQRRDLRDAPQNVG